MPHTRRRARPIKAALGLCVALMLTGPAQALDAITLQLKWTHAFQFAGYYAADARGYYREAGLAVDIVEAAPDTDVVAKVVSGEAQFGTGTSSLLLDRHAGRPVVVLAAIFQHSPQVIIARSGNDLQSVHDLQGKRLMLEGQSAELSAYLQQSGIRPEAISQIGHSFNVDDLIAGRTDAISAYQTYEPYLLQQLNYRHLVMTPRSVGIDFYGDNLFTSERELREHPARTQAFLKASLRGWEYALAHPDEIIDLIRQRHPERLQREHLRFEAEQMRPLIRADLVPIGYMHSGRWRHIADTYAQLGMLPADFPLDGILPAAEREAGWQTLIAPLMLAGLALVLLSAVAFHTQRLNRRLRSSQAELAERSDELLLQNQVLHLLNRGAPLPEVLETLAREVERRHPEVLCSILLIDTEMQCIRHGAAPSLPDFYNAAVNGLRIGEGIGSCGTAAFRDQRIIVEDIQTHPYWKGFRELASRAGIAACWSQPFHGRDSKVIGTFALYHRTPATPQAQHFARIERYAGLAELAVERARSDAALKLAETRYRLISENSNDVIWLLELPDLRFSYISPSVERLRGWSVEEIMAQPLAAALTPESAARVDRALRDSLAQIATGASGPHISTLEVDQPCKDGSTVATEVVTTILLDDQGQPSRILGITRDISERRRNEAALARHRAELEQRVIERTQELSIAKEAAEAANRAKSTFLATMSHELRTPMNAIIGMTHLASQRATDDKQKSQLAKVDGAARHLLAIINDILDLSRIEAGRLTLEQTGFTLDGLVDGLRPLLEPLAVDKQLALIFELPPAVATRRLIGDAHRLTQVLLNLGSNALKFTEAGQVKLNFTLAGNADRWLLQCAVSDTGIGIPLEAQGHLFEAFIQADGSMTRRYGGSGLGLAICKRLVEMMGGRIGLESLPGKGSRFWFEVPLAAAPELEPGPARPTALPATAGLGGQRVLLAEDEAVSREVFCELLGDCGMLVDTASNGLEAIAKVGAGSYDLILMDIQMPGLNGLEATRAIRALPGCSKLPIIALTANAFEEDRLRCLEAGMNDHLGKPVEPEQLFATLQRWLQPTAATSAQRDSS